MEELPNGERYVVPPKRRKILAVALLDHEDHLDVDDDKADNLPKDAGPQKLDEGGGHHRLEAGLVGSDVFLDGMVNASHIFSFFLCLSFLIRGSMSSPA